MEGYTPEVEQKMPRFFGWLSEKDRRRYAAVEAAQLGHGGVEYSAQIGPASLPTGGVGKTLSNGV